MSKPSADLNQRKRCFDPVVDEQTRLLLLGSLPGEKSLALQQYYGNRHNQFWTLMADVMGVQIPADYPARLEILRQHGIGLWDVVAEAHRQGSLDSRIRDRDDNDLCGLLARFPKIEAIGFNGGTAAKHGLKVLGEFASRFHVVALPSSSPAHTMPYAEKLAKWKLLGRHLRTSA
jgi:hypoxanthine-DNA glycosylase